MYLGDKVEPPGDATIIKGLQKCSPFLMPVTRVFPTLKGRSGKKRGSGFWLAGYST